MKPDITLIFPNSVFLINDGVFPPLGIMYLSAYLKKKGVRVQCLDFGIGHKKEEAEANIVGISFTTPQRKEAFGLLDYYKEEGKYVIAGGPHATHMPEECFRNGFHWVISGYGEEDLYQCVYMLIKDKIEPRFCGESENIDHYPFPDRNCVPIKEYTYTIDGIPATTIMTSRGCPYNCSFCARIDKTYKSQSAARTLSEIYSINNQFGFEAFMIFDDTFIANKKRLSYIANGVNGSNFKFRCFSRSNLINEKTCREMERMGIVEVGIGIESGSDAVLERNMKGTTRQVNLNAVHMLHDHGIRAKAFLIVGLPGETEETVKETESWIREAKPYDVDISIFQPLPGSILFENPSKYGLTFKYDGDSMFYKGKPGQYKSNSRTEGLDCETIEQLRQTLEDTFKRRELLK